MLLKQNKTGFIIINTLFILMLSGCGQSEVPEVLSESFTAEVSSGYVKPSVLVPSVNVIPPDIRVSTPGGETFAQLFENVENEGISITLDESAKDDTVSSGTSVSADTNLQISISEDRLRDMKVSVRPDTPLTLYYKMSSYTYKGRTLHGACTPMTMINCLNSFNNNGECSLTETLDLASMLGIWSPQDGMSAEGVFISIAALNDLHQTANCAALFGPKDCDELGDIIDSGLTAGVCVDSSMLWKGKKDGYADHMIAVLGTDRDIYGTLKGFDIIDSGMGMTYISADLYDECALGNKLGFVMVFGNPENPPY